MAKKINPNNLKRLRRLIEINLSHHAVLFTISLENSYFVNLKNPAGKTRIIPETSMIFDKDSPAYNLFRFNWRLYPVTCQKDAFGNFHKQTIHDVGYDLVNATWQQAIDEALVVANKELGKIEPRWRMNCGIVFCIDKATIDATKIEEIISMDKNFHIWDPDREISTDSERKSESLALLQALEAVA